MHPHKGISRILVLILILIATSILTLFYFFKQEKVVQKVITQKRETVEPKSQSLQQYSIIAKDLNIPWSLVFLDSEKIIFTERDGQIKILEKSGEVKKIHTIEEVDTGGERGLLGLALHPEFNSNKFIYFYYSYKNNKEFNKVVRFRFENDKLINPEIIVDLISGASNHDGGRIKFGPDKNLYILTGDAQNEKSSQDKNSLAGKILRVTDTGKAVEGNPFGNLIYSLGHRNPQGLDWDQNGNLWTTEHGRSGLQSGLDEINLISLGKNYGWPDLQGDLEKIGFEKPIKHSAADTWAPSGAVFYKNSFFFGGLRGSALYEVVIEDKKIVDFKTHFQNKFGRIRDVILGLDDMLYISTSNKDGRGISGIEDDKIIKINPDLL